MRGVRAGGEGAAGPGLRLEGIPSDCIRASAQTLFQASPGALGSPKPSPCP